MKAAILALLLAGCANNPQCVMRDMSATPTMVAIPVSGMVVMQAIHPCVRWQ